MTKHLMCESSYRLQTVKIKSSTTMAVASGEAKQIVENFLTLSLSGVLGVDSLNFTMTVYLCNLSQPIRSS